MSKFEQLMDDMKQALIISVAHKKVFLGPIIGSLVTNLITVIMLVILVVMIAGGSIFLIIDEGNGLIPFVIIAVIISLGVFALITALTLIIEVGVANMLKSLLNGEPIPFTLFWDGIKQYFLRALATSIGFFFIMLFVYILLFIPILLYVLTVGILSGGWAMIALTTLTQALIGYWLLIMVNDDCGGFKSIGKNLKFGSSHMKIMMLIFFIQMRLATNLSGFLGLLGLLVAFAIVAIVNTYMKVVILSTYRRYTNTSQPIQ